MLIRGRGRRERMIDKRDGFGMCESSRRYSSRHRESEIWIEESTERVERETGADREGGE